MPNEIFENLLAQAKQQLSAADFENAAKSAKGLLALDESSTEAADILKAASAAIESGGVSDGAMSPYDEEVKTKAKLRQLALDVQVALNAKKMFDATKMVENYLIEFPNVWDAEKMLADVKRAHSALNTTRERVNRQQNRINQGTLPSVGRTGEPASGAGDEAGCLNYGLSFLLFAVPGLIIQYIFRKQGWTGVVINLVLSLIFIIWVLS